MAPFHKILVPTDFSPCSDEAVRIAAGMSKLCGAPLTVMTVFETLFVPLVPEGALMPRPEIMAAGYAQARERLLEAGKAATAAGAVGVTETMPHGVPVDEILALARSGGFDLVVMGTHGRTGIKHALLGSVAEKVVRKAPCAVLAVREPR